MDKLACRGGLAVALLASIGALSCAPKPVDLGFAQKAQSVKLFETRADDLDSIMGRPPGKYGVRRVYFPTPRDLGNRSMDKRIIAEDALKYWSDDFRIVCIEIGEGRVRQIWVGAALPMDP